MRDDQSVTFWIGKLKEGNPEAAEAIWQRYFERLVRLVRQKLHGVSRRAVDEEDVALSAFDSFYGGVRKGRFPRLDDRDDLWQILIVFAGWKIVDLRKREGAQKRGKGKVRGESAFLPKQDEVAEAGIRQVVGSEPTPEMAATVAEESRRLLDSLGDDTLRQIALLKMEGYTNEEIALRLGCVRRTIDRKLKRIRSVWSRESPEAIEQPRETER